MPKLRAIEALDDRHLEAEWDRQHYWPDAILVNGVDIGATRRAFIRALNTARQAREVVEDPTQTADPTPQDIAVIEQELHHAPP